MRRESGGMRVARGGRRRTNASTLEADASGTRPHHSMHRRASLPYHQSRDPEPTPVVGDRTSLPSRRAGAPHGRGTTGKT